MCALQWKSIHTYMSSPLMLPALLPYEDLKTVTSPWLLLCHMPRLMLRTSMPRSRMPDDLQCRAIVRTQSTCEASEGKSVRKATESRCGSFRCYFWLAGPDPCSLKRVSDRLAQELLVEVLRLWTIWGLHCHSRGYRDIGEHNDAFGGQCLWAALLVASHSAKSTLCCSVVWTCKGAAFGRFEIDHFRPGNFWLSLGLSLTWLAIVCSSPYDKLARWCHNTAML